jgi:hypothetical protein
LFFYSVLVIESTSLYNLVVDIKLEPSALIHGFFNTLLGYETKNEHVPRLADTMSTILRLQVSNEGSNRSQS